MITPAKLKSHTVKDLAAMAKRKGVPGWHSMRKEELVVALVKRAKAETAKAARKAKSNGHKPTSKVKAVKTTSNGSNGRAKASSNGHAKASSNGGPKHNQRRLNKIRASMSQSKDLAYSARGDSGYSKDRAVLMVRDPFWLHVYWELTRQSVERARVAMGPNWHGAKPVLRLSEVTRDGTTNTVRKVVRDIEIHGGVSNWYIDVQDPPRSYQVDVGYLAPDGKFVCMCRSNAVSTPQAGAVDSMDGNWAGVAADFDRIYAMSGGYGKEGDTADLQDLFEERLKRPMGSPVVTRFGRGAGVASYSRRELDFSVDSELVVYGVASAGAHVTIRGEPVRLQPDGTFTVRFKMPDRRQVLPVVASSGDGVEQRTIVLAVERNTKVMEPVIRDPDS